jgi:hypothetical protein
LSELPQSTPEPSAQLTRSGRRIRLPARFIDALPEPGRSGTRTIVSRVPEQPVLAPDPLVDPPPTPPVYETQKNAYGLFKQYPRRPTVDPDTGLGISELSDPLSFRMHMRGPPSRVSTAPTGEPYYAPFSNHVSAALFTWEASKSSNKSASESDRIAQLLGSAPTEDLATDLRGFKHKKEARRLDKYMASTDTPLSERDGWKKSTVTIPLPCDGVRIKESEAPQLKIDGVYHQDILDLIVSRYETSSHFHMTPYKLYWEPSPGKAPQRVRINMYDSTAALVADREIQAIRLPADEEELERVTAFIIAASDSSHLAQFGSASLWPIYIRYGAEDKYISCRPTANSCDHVAYIPLVSTFLTLGSIY